MPIKPENKKLYPPNWASEIRPAALESAGNKCQFCLVPDKIFIARGLWQGEPVWQDDDGAIHSANDGRYITHNYCSDLEGTVTHCGVVLTIMHLDHDPTNCEPENLKAACQRCHLNYDREDNQKKARETRKKNRGLIDLFPEA